MASLRFIQVSSAPVRASSAWSDFHHALGKVVQGLQDGQTLVVSVSGSNRFVRFGARNGGTLRVETPGNSFLRQGDRLDDGQLAALFELGWHAPADIAELCGPAERSAQLSPLFSVDLPAFDSRASATELALQTFIEVIRVPYPSMLRYQAFDAEHGDLVFPDLGLKRGGQAAPGESIIELRKRLVSTLIEVTGMTGLAPDADGDIEVHFGPIPVFVRIEGSDPMIRIHSPLLLDIAPSVGLYKMLNSLNVEAGPIRWFHRKGVVAGCVELPALPYSADHVSAALNRFCHQCDTLLPTLQAELGGRPLIGTPPPQTVLH
jgi:hypothetical protein